MNSVEKSGVFSLQEYSERAAAVEMDQESNGSSAEEAESPRSVEKWKGRSYKLHVHSQIMRIRAEDSHLGEDIIGEGNLSLKDNKFGVAHFMLFSKPILPASPLSGRTAH